MTVFEKKAPANFVPAAAVIRKGLVLFKITGRKGCVGRNLLVLSKILISILKLFFKTNY
jgi:hypothetical protein